MNVMNYLKILAIIENTFPRACAPNANLCPLSFKSQIPSVTLVSFLNSFSEKVNTH